MNYNALKYITGYDLSSEDKLKENNINSVSIISEKGFIPKLIITKKDGSKEHYALDYTEYNNYIRKEKLNKLLNG